uniref:Uncharacterized protein n=1 Tax=Salmonella enterica I TaxID=59201 RepID=F2Q935_SALET|nr:hypothetical protein [Salmonella enterica subsp. enterica] [Salmonella enterica subsp. enterica serovar Senftenberg]
MIRTIMAWVSIACGDLVLVVLDGWLISSNRAASGISKLASEKWLSGKNLTNFSIDGKWL